MKDEKQIEEIERIVGEAFFEDYNHGCDPCTGTVAKHLIGAGWCKQEEDEVKRLTDILNSYALQYGTVKDQHEVIDKAKRETAKEIFEEIEERLTQVAESGYIGYLDCLAELKKKYVGGE